MPTIDARRNWPQRLRDAGFVDIALDGEALERGILVPVETETGKPIGNLIEVNLSQSPSEVNVLTIKLVVELHQGEAT